MKPLEHGADIVYHSATKFLSGHGPWSAASWWMAAASHPGKVGTFPRADRPLRRFPQHGVQRGKQHRRLPAARAAQRPARLRRLHEPAPAWLILQGIETLPLRMERHIRNTEKVVKFPWPAIRWWAAWATRCWSPIPRTNWQRSCCRAAGSVFSFDIKGNRNQGRKFIETLKVFGHLANVGDCRSLVIHPASTTHFRMSEKHWPRPASARARYPVHRTGGSDDLIDDLKRPSRPLKRQREPTRRHQQ
ncbi:Cystathionine gamma-lyase [Manis javanica]|nr:Cystathionine gamma-lyase [Manis javanica]